MRYIFNFLFLASSILLLNSCGNSAGGSQPSDLDFNGASTAEAYSDVVLYSISSFRGGVLHGQYKESIPDLKKFKKTVGSYAEAMRKTDWLRDDKEIVQDGNTFLKEYRWLDKRRRLAASIKVATTKRGNEISLNEIEFFSNLDVLEKVKY